MKNEGRWRWIQISEDGHWLRVEWQLLITDYWWLMTDNAIHVSCLSLLCMMYVCMIIDNNMVCRTCRFFIHFMSHDVIIISWWWWRAGGRGHSCDCDCDWRSHERRRTKDVKDPFQTVPTVPSSKTDDFDTMMEWDWNFILEPWTHEPYRTWKLSHSKNRRSAEIMWWRHITVTVRNPIFNYPTWATGSLRSSPTCLDMMFLRDTWVPWVLQHY